MTIILVLSAGLRFYDLGARDIWIDEANGVLIAQQPPAELIAGLRLDSNPPLYYLLLKAWMAVCGDSEAAVRGLSAVCGLALVGAVALIGRRMASAEVGLLAAALLACSPIQIVYSQQARMYVLLALLALLATYWLWRAITTRPARFVAAYGITLLAALYTHNCALYLLPAHAIVVWWSGALRRQPWRWVVCGAGVAAGYAPWVPVLLGQLANPAQYCWFAPVWQQLGWLGALLKTFHSFAPGGSAPGYMHISEPTEYGPVKLTWLPATLFTVIAALSLLPALRARRAVGAPARSQPAIAGAPPPGLAIRLLLTCTGLPLAAGLIASALLTPNYVPGRTDQLVFPGFILLLALGLSIVRPRALRYALLATWIGFSVLVLRTYYETRPMVGDRVMAEAIRAQAQPGDAVLTTSLTRAALEYYLRRAGAPVTLYSYPRDTARHLGNQHDAGWLADPERLEREVPLLWEQIAAEGGPRRRVFVVLVPSPVNKPLYADVRSRQSDLLMDVGEYCLSGTQTMVRVILLRL